MVEQNETLRADLHGFFESEGAFEKLLAICALTKPDDQDYVAEEMMRVISEPGYAELNSVIAERSHGNDFVNAASHILSNKDVQPIDLGQTTGAFQDMSIKLAELRKQEGGQDLANGALFYGVSTAYIEYDLEAKHPGQAYDADTDGPIIFATVDHNDSGVA